MTFIMEFWKGKCFTKKTLSHIQKTFGMFLVASVLEPNPNQVSWYLNILYKKYLSIFYLEVPTGILFLALILFLLLSLKYWH